MKKKNKAIFKFNGGLRALLCSECSVIIKTGLEFTEKEWDAADGKTDLEAQFCKECLGEDTVTYTLVRERDGMTLSGTVADWVEWSEEGRYKAHHPEPALDRSLILDKHKGDFFTWLTTPITQLLVNTNDTIVFETQNSKYTLTKTVKHGRKPKN